MLTKLSQARSEEGAHASRLQFALWTVWTIFVVGFAVVHWQLDLEAHSPAPVIGLVIHTLLAGLVGLIVMTLVEMRFYPEDFVDTSSRCDS